MCVYIQGDSAIVLKQFYLISIYTTVQNIMYDESFFVKYT